MYRVRRERVAGFAVFAFSPWRVRGLAREGRGKALSVGKAHSEKL